MKTWREHSFKSGASYKATESVCNSVCSIEKGEELIYDHSSYSAYDGSTGYIFKTANGGEIKTVFVDDDDEDLTGSIFIEKV